VVCHLALAAAGLVAFWASVSAGVGGVFDTGMLEKLLPAGEVALIAGGAAVGHVVECECV
jgi:hypothetical protein